MNVGFYFLCSLIFLFYHSNKILSIKFLHEVTRPLHFNSRSYGATQEIVTTLLLVVFSYLNCPQ
jgi:small neutral amino acid transporter SnatA (MarC family)